MAWFIPSQRFLAFWAILTKAQRLELFPKSQRFELLTQRESHGHGWKKTRSMHICDVNPLGLLNLLHVFARGGNPDPPFPTSPFNFATLG